MALVAVLWVIGFLLVLLTSSAHLLKIHAETGFFETHRFYSKIAAKEGLSYAMHPLVDRYDPLLQSTPGAELGNYTASIEMEASRINFNAVIASNDRGFLFDLFKYWGLSDQQTDLLVDALIDWVDADDLPLLNGAEREFYESEGLRSFPYNRPFRTLSEISHVRGFAEVIRLRPDWQDWLTIYTSAIDIYECTPEILAIAAVTDVETASGFLESVKGGDSLIGTEDDVRYGSLENALDLLLSPAVQRPQISKRFQLQSATRRIVSNGFSGELKTTLTVVAEAGTSPQILSYRKRTTSFE